MGRLRKRHNWKARLSNDIECAENERVKETETSKNITNGGSSYYGAALTGSNALVLPSKKVEKKFKLANLNSTKKKLTKKERRRLEKVVESKRKKSKRADVLKLLAESSVKEGELSQYGSSSRLGQSSVVNDLKRKISVDNNTVLHNELQSAVKRGKKKGKRERLRKKMTENKKVVVETKEPQSSDEESVEESVDEKDDCDQVVSDPPSEVIVESKDNSFTSDVIMKTNDHPTPIAGANKPATFVGIVRNAEIQAARLQLPILGEEQVVMEAIKHHQIVLLVGETGSGKTTQVPQFLYEAGYGIQGIIGITEPRRVAAVNMSKRVALEMNMPAEKVSYQIRYEGNTTPQTCLKFMTDGVLLREVEKDFLLSSYSVIVIDEAHERSVYTDILIGLLSRIVLLRKKKGNVLKLIIMSATLRVEDFTNNTILFNPTPPVVKVESRQYPVTIHFNKSTPDDHVGEAFKKVTKIHRTLPEGGILVFLTGQSEIHSLCRKLRTRFPFKRDNLNELKNKNADPKKKNINLDDYSVNPRSVMVQQELEDEDIGEKGDWLDDASSDSDDELVNHADATMPMYVLPLYSLLSNEKQQKIFQTPPAGARFCVVATNVAETSLTIPNIKYVVDSGMVKRRYYDKTTGVSTFKITWTSKASSNQRAGRAGRVGPGHCYRLFSSAVFNNDFEEFTQPDILRRPVDDLVLQMKAINIDKVVNFPFPTPPDTKVLESAEKLLVDLGALVLQKNKKGLVTSVISKLGRTMTKFPVSPRFAKMICLGDQNNCLQYVVVLVAALTVQEIFSQSNPHRRKEDDAKELQGRITRLRRAWAGDGPSQLLGDYMVMLRAVGAAEYAGCSTKFCNASGLRQKAMVEIRKLRVQLTNAVNAVNVESKLYVEPKMTPPSAQQTKTLRQIILACFGDNVARRTPPEQCNDPKLKNAYQCHLVNDPVFIHPTSALFNILPEYIVFQEIMETTKLYVKGVAAIEPDWLATLVPQHCSFSKPLKIPAPRYDEAEGVVKCHINISFGTRMWCMPQQELHFPRSAEEYKWFGKFFLHGDVCRELAQFKDQLLGLPSSMVKSWSKLQPRTEAVYQQLVNKGVHDKASLEAAWEEDQDFLLNAYLQWLPVSKHEDVKKAWPPHNR